MPYPPQNLVQPILEEVRPAIVDAIFGAWTDWWNSPHRGVWRCKRSRANFVWEQIIERAHMAFNGHSQVRILDGNESFKFLVADQVLFRFKKGDDSGLTSNVATQLALAFHDHEQDLFGLPEVYRVEIIYKLNRLETEVVDVCVVARENDKVVWQYSLLDAEDAVVPLPMNGPANEPDSKPAARLVKVRDSGEPAARKKRD